MNKNDFPILMQADNNGKKLVYLDNASTTQKPLSVINAVNDFYKTQNANPHRGSYNLSVEAGNILETVREKVRKFINAEKLSEIVFTKNSTEALNLIASCYGEIALNAGDNVVIAISEHHSNILPWQRITKKQNASLLYLYTDENYLIPQNEIENKITDKTKIVAVSHVCNTTGVINPVKQIIERAHKVGAAVVIDGTQSVPNMPVNAPDLDADFYIFSGHKMLAPMGIGVMYGKEKFLEIMPPFMLGGDMIEYVDQQSATFAALPQKFEAGTINVGAIAGLGAAIDYLQAIGMQKIEAYEKDLTEYLLTALKAVPHLNVIGPKTTENRIGVVAFTIDDVHPHDISTILDADNIAIRAGNHCAQPLHRFYNLSSTCRASIYLYNTKDDIDKLVSSLKTVRGRMGYEP